MKILKKAKQKNVVLNKDYYTPYTINDMLRAHEIAYFAKEGACYVPLDSSEIEEETFRIFTENLSELKVVLGEDGHYETVAIGLNGKTYHVEI